MKSKGVVLFLLSAFIALLAFSCKKPSNISPLPSALPSETVTSITVFNQAQAVDISFANQQIGYIASSYEPSLGAATIAKTIDSGKTWKQIPIILNNDPTTIIRSVYAKSQDSVYATFTAKSGASGVCFTHDGGVNWSKLSTLTPVNSYYNVFFRDAMVGFLGNGGDTYKTIDGGNNWNKTNVPRLESNIGFSSTLTGYAYGGYVISGIVSYVGNYGGVAKTTDGGNTWLQLPVITSDVTNAIIVNDNLVYAFTFDGNAYKTSDGGNSWQLLTNALPQPYLASAIIASTIYFAGGNTIYKTTDDFKTMKQIYQSPNQQDNFSTKTVSTNAKTVFVLSSEQTVLKIAIN